MNRTTTAKEALMAELITDVEDLIARVEALTPAMNGTRQALTEAARTVAGSVAPFRKEIAEIANASKTSLMGDIESRAYEVAATSSITSSTRCPRPRERSS
jgi:outer membrane murein-binding lipoprotein Lpp